MLICGQCGQKAASLAQNLCMTCAPELHGLATQRASRRDDLVSILRISDEPLSNAAADRIEALEGAVRGMLEAMAMGTVEIAAKYGPDAHPDAPLIDAAHKAQSVLKANGSQPDKHVADVMAEALTQDFRLQNDREWREKVEWQKQRAKELIQLHDAFLTLSGETKLQMDAALTPTRAREFVAEIEGELIIWESEGGFAPSTIQIAHLQLESWLAEKLDIPVTERGNAEQGRYGKIVLKLERPKC